MMLHKLATPLLQSATDYVVKERTDYLGFWSNKQTFAFASLEHHLMTMRMLVSKQNKFSDHNPPTHSILLRSIQPWKFPCFNKIKQEITHCDCFDLKRESRYSK